MNAKYRPNTSLHSMDKQAIDIIGADFEPDDRRIGFVKKCYFNDGWCNFMLAVCVIVYKPIR